MQLVLTIVFAVLCAFNVEAKTGDEIQGRVEKNVDGDTIWVKAETNRINPRLKVRMVGIDAPETHFENAAGKMVNQGHYGEEASKQLAELIPVGTSVTVEERGQDVYKRMLGRVYLRSTDINLRMVEIGWAIPYIICEGRGCTPDFIKRENVRTYLNACEDARAKKLGLFGGPKPLTEMPFEFRLRMKNDAPNKYVGDVQTRKYYRPADYKKVDLCNRIFFMKEVDAESADFKPAF